MTEFRLAGSCRRQVAGLTGTVCCIELRVRSRRARQRQETLACLPDFCTSFHGYIEIYRRPNSGPWGSSTWASRCPWNAPEDPAAKTRAGCRNDDHSEGAFFEILSDRTLQTVVVCGSGCSAQSARASASAPTLFDGLEAAGRDIQSRPRRRGRPGERALAGPSPRSVSSG